MEIWKACVVYIAFMVSVASMSALFAASQASSAPPFVSDSPVANLGVAYSRLHAAETANALGFIFRGAVLAREKEFAAAVQAYERNTGDGNGFQYL